MFLLLRQMGFLGEIHVVIQLSLIGLFGRKLSSLQPEIPKLQEVLLSKVIQFSQEENVLDAPASKKDGFLWRDTGVS
jgi:hypothetical protein